MGKLITIDPVTRIEGHLRIDVEVDGGAVRNAWSSGTMWRGIETILQGRDPRDAWVFTQRICGVCTTVHAIASVRVVENALGLEIPLNAQLIRNIIIAAHALHDHIVHFYHLSALDWVDVVTVLKADRRRRRRPSPTRLGLTWPGNSKHALAAVKEKVKDFVAAGQLGIFTNGYWGHPAMKLSPEVNLLAVAHYLQALDIQRKANQVVAILGCEDAEHPEPRGGRRGQRHQPRQPGRPQHGEAVPGEDAARRGLGLHHAGLPAGRRGHRGELPGLAQVRRGRHELPRGAGHAGRREDDAVRPARRRSSGTATSPRSGRSTSWNDEYLRQNVTESIARSWYDGDWTKGPWEGETVPKFRGEWKHETPAPQRYSWVKSPRLEGKPVQVGPLAQVLVGYAQGHEGFKKWGDWMLGTAGKIAGVKLSPAVLHSTLGRHAARAMRVRGPRRPREEALEAPRREHRQGRHRDLRRPDEEPEARDLQGRRLPRGAARDPLALVGHRVRRQEHEAQELPGGRAVDLERRAARREGSEGAVRGVARREPHRRIRSCPSRRSAPSTPSTRASPAPSTPSTPTARRSPR